MSKAIEVGQVFLSRDHRNLACQYLRVLAVTDAFVTVERFVDPACTIPGKGKPVPIHRVSFDRPGGPSLLT